MATGVQPAFEPQMEEKTKPESNNEVKPLSRRERILRKLHQIFEHNLEGLE